MSDRYAGNLIHYLDKSDKGDRVSFGRNRMLVKKACLPIIVAILSLFSIENVPSDEPVFWIELRDIESDLESVENFKECFDLALRYEEDRVGIVNSLLPIIDTYVSNTDRDKVNWAENFVILNDKHEAYMNRLIELRRDYLWHMNYSDVDLYQLNFILNGYLYQLKSLILQRALIQWSNFDRYYFALCDALKDRETNKQMILSNLVYLNAEIKRM